MKRLVYGIIAAAIAVPGISQAASHKKEHNKPGYKDANAFRAKTHESDMQTLKQRLDQNQNLSADDKTRLIQLYERHYKENTARWQQRTRENILYYKRISADTKMTDDEKKIAVREHFKNRARMTKRTARNRKLNARLFG